MYVVIHITTNACTHGMIGHQPRSQFGPTCLDTFIVKLVQLKAIGGAAVS